MRDLPEPCEMHATACNESSSFVGQRVPGILSRCELQAEDLPQVQVLVCPVFNLLRSLIKKKLRKKEWGSRLKISLKASKVEKSHISLIFWHLPLLIFWMKKFSGCVLTLLTKFEVE